MLEIYDHIARVSNIDRQKLILDLKDQTIQ